MKSLNVYRTLPRLLHTFQFATCMLCTFSIFCRSAFDFCNGCGVTFKFTFIIRAVDRIIQKNTLCYFSILRVRFRMENTQERFLTEICTYCRDARLQNSHNCVPRNLMRLIELKRVHNFCWKRRMKRCSRAKCISTHCSHANPSSLWYSKLQLKMMRLARNRSISI